jgi:hypothetical protein
MRKYDNDLDNGYILLRVFDVNTNPGVKIFPYPWKLYIAGDLYFKSINGYEVHDVQGAGT